ncbi:MAG: HD domain-containing protein [Thermotogae bacterium]|nr:HD domain-containing protein [Thermotogota bacterium]
MWISEVKESKEGAEVSFRGIVLRQKDGYRYKVFDRSGEIWIDSEFPLREGGAYEFVGRYKGGVVVVERAEELEEIDVKYFLPFAENPERDERRFWGVVERISDPRLREFVRFVFEPIWDEFKRGVAAKRYHHAYIGGLLEHTATVGEIVVRILPLYADYGINPDLVILGALFHDVGKAWELKTFPKFEYHEKYGKWGHIFIGANLIKEKGREFGLPEETLTDLVHIILAHHGEYGKGSPVSPRIPEALLVHLADNLDAQMNHVLKDESKD